MRSATCLLSHSSARVNAAAEHYQDFVFARRATRTEQNVETSVFAAPPAAVQTVSCHGRPCRLNQSDFGI